jgi:hypothetical protein
MWATEQTAAVGLILWMEYHVEVVVDFSESQEVLRTRVPRLGVGL